MNDKINKLFTGQNDHNLIVLPIGVGLVITIISYLLGDTKNNQYMIISSLPMMIGAMLSALLAFSGVKKIEAELKNIQSEYKINKKWLAFGILIGAYPLIVGLWYIL